MIKVILILLLLSGETKSFEAQQVFPDTLSCKVKALDTMLTLQDDPNIIGMGFSCKPAGIPS